MKRYIYSASAFNKTYTAVDQALNTLFNISYSVYKDKSDWIDTKYGKLKYKVYTTMNDQSSFTIKILFDVDTFDENKFYQLLKDAKNNGMYISAQYPFGYNEDYPQINIRVKKSSWFSKDTVQALQTFTEDLFEHYTGSEEAIIQLYAWAGRTLEVDVMYPVPDEWVADNQHSIQTFIDAFPEEIMKSFDSIRSVKLADQDSSTCTFLLTSK